MSYETILSTLQLHAVDAGRHPSSAQLSAEVAEAEYRGLHVQHALTACACTHWGGTLQMHTLQVWTTYGGAALNHHQ